MTEEEYRSYLDRRKLKKAKQIQQEVARPVQMDDGPGIPAQDTGARATGTGAVAVNSTGAEDKAKAVSVLRNLMSNTKGKQLEDIITFQCGIYRRKGVAIIEKTPEPFLVLKKEKNGMFTGRFTAKHAQPDFQGTLAGGRSIVIEAKSTSKDRILFRALTETQQDLLEVHSFFGALFLVLCEIQENAFSIPWIVWKEMKERYGRKYLRADDIREYQIDQQGKEPLPFLLPSLFQPGTDKEEATTKTETKG